MVQAGFEIVAGLGGFRTQQRLQWVIPLQGRNHTHAAGPGHCHRTVFPQDQGAGRPYFRQLLPAGQLLQHRLSLWLQGSLPESIAVNELLKFQLDKQAVQLFFIGLPPYGFLGRKGDGRIAADGGQVIGQGRALPPGLQLFPKLGPDGGVIQMPVHSLHGAKFQQQLFGRLRAHTGDAGNVVGAVSHQTFQIHQNGRCKAVLCLEHGLIIAGGRGLAPLGDDQLHLDMGINQLQTVPVASDHHTVPVLLPAPLAHSADDVVCLPALALQDGDVHGPEHLF